MISIAKKQIQIIKIAQQQLGIDDTTYREMLFNNFRVKSCTKLSHDQANALIGMMKKKGFRIKSSKSKGKRFPRESGNVVRLASQAEFEKINALSKLINWRVKDGLTRWLAKRFSIKRVRTAQEAYQAIEGLKKMFENQMKKKYGPDWWELLFGDPGIQRYIDEHGPKEKPK